MLGNKMAYHSNCCQQSDSNHLTIPNRYKNLNQAIQWNLQRSQKAGKSPNSKLVRIKHVNKKYVRYFSMTSNNALGLYH